MAHAPGAKGKTTWPFAAQMDRIDRPCSLARQDAVVRLLIVSGYLYKPSFT